MKKKVTVCTLSVCKRERNKNRNTGGERERERKRWGGGGVRGDLWVGEEASILLHLLVVSGIAGPDSGEQQCPVLLTLYILHSEYCHLVWGGEGVGGRSDGKRV